MKKWGLLGLTVLLTACSSLNKNTVSYQMSRYDATEYYTVAGEGMTKEEASSNALENMRREMVQRAPSAESLGVIGDLTANAKVEKVWRDNQANTKHFYAIAALKRENARKILEPLLDQADTKLAGLASQFAEKEDPLSDLKIAYKMQPLTLRRSALEELYTFLSADGKGYKTEEFVQYKNIFKSKLAAVNAAVDMTGEHSETFITYVVDSLNRMGLGIVDSSAEEKALLVTVVAEVDGYESKKVDGLVWVSSGAAVSLKDVQRGVVFARFNVHERAGTSRAQDSLRRSMQGAGEQAALQTVEKLETYLKTR